MAHTLRDQLIAANTAREAALRRMYQTIEHYQEALARIADLEAKIASTRAMLKELADAESAGQKDDVPQRRHQRVAGYSATEQESTAAVGASP